MENIAIFIATLILSGLCLLAGVIIFIVGKIKKSDFLTRLTVGLFAASFTFFRLNDIEYWINENLIVGITNVIYISAFILLAVAMFRNKDGIIPVIASGLGTLCAVYWGFDYIHEIISYYEAYSDAVAYIAVEIFFVLSWVAMLVLSIICFVKKNDKKTYIKKLFFIPGALYFIGFMISLVVNMEYFLHTLQGLFEFDSFRYFVYDVESLYYILIDIMRIGMFLLAAHWLVKDKVQKQDFVNGYAQPVNTGYVPRQVPPNYYNNAYTPAPSPAPFVAQRNAPPNNTYNNSADATEMIRKYKQLFDDGIITEEEFEAKKKQLLGL